MISLASTSLKTGAALEKGEGRSAPAGTAAKGEGFSALLAVEGQAASGGDAALPQIQAPTGEAATGTEASEEATGLPPLPGIALPEIAESGKKLPVGLPAAKTAPAIQVVISMPGRSVPAKLEGAAAELGDSEASETDGDDTPQTVAAAPVLANAIQAALPVPTGEAAPEDGAPVARGAAPLPVRPMPAAAHSFAQTIAQGDSAKTPVKTVDASKQGAPSVAIEVAGQSVEAAHRTARDVAAATGVERADKQGAADASAPRSAATPADSPVAKAIAPADQPVPNVNTAAFAARPAETQAAVQPAHAVHNSAPVDALHNLTRIVDQFAAARDALAPATAALAIEHAEFGEMSVRFNQDRGGQLAVQLSASSPEARSALVAAVNHSAPSSQSHSDNSAGSQSGAQQFQSRDAGTGRESNSGSNASARHEQSPHQQRQAGQQARPRREARGQSGVFA